MGKPHDPYIERSSNWPGVCRSRHSQQFHSVRHLSDLRWIDRCIAVASFSLACFVSLLPTMNFLQTDGGFGQTTTHIFYKRDKIGTGASCDVFKGVEKASGQTRALKVSKDARWSQSEENIREVEALTKVTHRNIIGYYGKEEEYGTGRGVLVMEYCSGGSLQAFLQEPENIHGLEDKEFLTFLSDTCHGWKYLRQCGFVHRDIKPGNILRDVKLDGSVTYKLADFGASKRLEHHGEFMSLAGTEEYLHPAMYEKAFIDPGGRTLYTESVDMWSFGVTIYHTCTGDIPFKPFGGVRQNRSVMFTMITCKPSGAISGDQLTPSGDIRWKKTLPDTCLLSPYIRKKTIGIIGGLLEGDPRHQWTFVTLEDSVQKLVSLRRFNVINTEESTLVTAYVPSNPSLSRLQEAIAAATDVPASHQMLFHQDRLLNDQERGQCDVSAPDVEENNDEIILVTKDESDESRSQASSGRPLNFTARSTVEEDVRISIKMSSFMYVMLVQVLTSIRVQRGQGKAMMSLWHHLKDVLYKLEKKFKVLSETCRERQSRFETMRQMETTRREISRHANNHVTHATNKAKRVLNKLHKQLWQVKEEITSLREQIHGFCPRSSLPNRDQLKREIEGCFDEAKTILHRIRKRKDEQPLSEFEEIMHRKDRNDLTQLCQTCITQCQNHFLNNHRPVQLAFREAKSFYIKHYDKLLQVETELEEVSKGSSELSGVLTETWAFSGRAWKDVVSCISSLFKQPADTVKTTGRVTSDLKKDLDANTQRLKSLQEDLPELEVPDCDL